jgi:hypothetical protein
MSIDELKRDCGQMLAMNGVKPKTNTGKLMIYAFYQGVMVMRGPIPFVALCLSSGRYESLVEMSK